jgi:uncharacterized membrane protein YccC
MDTLIGILIALVIAKIVLADARRVLGVPPKSKRRRK